MLKDLIKKKREESSEKKIENAVNIKIDHEEEAFFSDGLTISHRPGRFIFDFSQSLPRFDNLPNGRKQTMVIKHKTVIVEPRFAKSILEVLKENLEKYEKNFGKLKQVKPKEVESTRYIG